MLGHLPGHAPQDQVSNTAKAVGPDHDQIDIHFVGAIHYFLRRFAINSDLSLRKQPLSREHVICGSENSLCLKASVDFATSAAWFLDIEQDDFGTFRFNQLTYSSSCFE